MLNPLWNADWESVVYFSFSTFVAGLMTGAKLGSSDALRLLWSPTCSASADGRITGTPWVLPRTCVEGRMTGVSSFVLPRPIVDDRISGTNASSSKSAVGSQLVGYPFVFGNFIVSGTSRFSSRKIPLMRLAKWGQSVMLKCHLKCKIRHSFLTFQRPPKGQRVL